MAKIAVLGYGVVGSGTVEVFYKNKESLEKKAGQEMDIKYILDVRDFNDSPYKDKFVKDFNVILNDPEVTVVAEVIGGLKPSYDFVKSSLEAGKSVVTSNCKGKECKLLLRSERRRRNSHYQAPSCMPFRKRNRRDRWYSERYDQLYPHKDDPRRHGL